MITHSTWVSEYGQRRWKVPHLTSTFWASVKIIYKCTLTRHLRHESNTLQKDHASKVIYKIQLLTYGMCFKLRDIINIYTNTLLPFVTIATCNPVIISLWACLSLICIRRVNYGVFYTPVRFRPTPVIHIISADDAYTNPKRDEKLQCSVNGIVYHMYIHIMYMIVGFSLACQGPYSVKKHR